MVEPVTTCVPRACAAQRSAVCCSLVPGRSGVATRAGRNIHALDPYRMPAPGAEARGYANGASILDAHKAANDGAYPETIAVNLWGLDAIKTRGESVALAAWAVGARPVREGTGRVARFELIPLEELGRPRIDVLCNMSGIFRCAPARAFARLVCTVTLYDRMALL